MAIDRRRLLQLGRAATLGSLAPLGACSRRPTAPAGAPGKRPDYTIRIADAKVELAPGVDVVTTTYNGGFPGPLIRLQEGRRVAVDIHNDTGRPEQLHWHGQKIPVDV